MFRVMKDIPGGKEIHSVFLIFKDNGEFLPIESSCTCIYGSFYGQSRVNRGKVCDHINQALGKYDKEQKEKFIKLVEGKNIENGRKEKEIFNHIKIYLSNRNLNKNFVNFLP